MADPIVIRPARVLVVDDDRAVRQVVRRGLEREGHVVSEAADGAAALAGVAAGHVDVAVLDLNLPDMSGLDVLTELRRDNHELHVIMLTGAGSETDRVRGLVSGADDYMVKPFSVRELAARIAVVRRRRVPSVPDRVDVGDLHIDTSARTARIGDEALELTRREFDLLCHLAANQGRTCTRQELLEAVWSSSAEWQSPATVTEHVRRLRKKIEGRSREGPVIVTMRGSGYRFDLAGGDLATGPGPGSVRIAELTEDATVVLLGAAIVHASPAALALVGASDPHEVLGRDVFDFVASRSLGAAAVRHETIKQGRWPRPEVLSVVRLDGDEVLVQIASVPVTWEGQEASQLTMWELEGDTAKLQEMVTGIRTDVPDAVVITDAELRIQRFNAAAEVLYGWQEHEVVGWPTSEVLPWVSDDLELEASREALHRTGNWHGEVEQLRRDGTKVTVQASVTLLRDSDGETVGLLSVNRPVDRSHRRGSDRPSAARVHDAEMRRGAERGEFVVHYQPVVRLDSGRWDGVEALVRWQHPERGLLAPDAFIDDAERSGAIVDIGGVVLEAACQQWRRWRDAGHELNVAVNLSARQLSEPRLEETLRRSMSAVDMPAGQLWLEITETTLVHDLDEAAEALRRVDDLGARIAIDDFGTGWASLAYLRHFPVHALKIDRMFVQGLGTNPTDATILHSVVRLAHELELTVIPEGIETPAQLAHLLQLECDLGQGYLLGRPMPADALGLAGP